MHDLVIVKNDIVNNGFPELSNVNISLDYRKLSEAYLEFDRIGKNNYHIDVEKKLGESPLTVLEGGLAHDLAHISKDHDKSWLTHEIDILLYSNWPWYETRDERQTDLLVVERGYGSELLSFLKYADERREEYTSADGLTARELEQILARSTTIVSKKVTDFE